jgi:hypothetical protein
MPVSMMTLECPCCGRELEVILVGSAHTEEEFELAPKKRRKRRSKGEQGDGGLVDDADGGHPGNRSPG